MNHKATNYAKDLMLVHGPKYALKIAAECETITKQPTAVPLYGEADFHLNKNGHLEYSKHQTGKLDNNRKIRERQSVNFWQDVVCFLKKNQPKEK